MASTSSTTTRPWRIQCRERSDVEPRPLVLSDELMSVREAIPAGTVPNIRPVSIDTANVNPMTRRSSGMGYSKKRAR